MSITAKKRSRRASQDEIVLEEGGRVRRSMSFEGPLYQRMEALAKLDRRNVNNWIEVQLETVVAEQEALKGITQEKQG